MDQTWLANMSTSMRCAVNKQIIYLASGFFVSGPHTRAQLERPLVLCSVSCNVNRLCWLRRFWWLLRFGSIEEIFQIFDAENLLVQLNGDMISPRKTSPLELHYRLDCVKLPPEWPAHSDLLRYIDGSHVTRYDKMPNSRKPTGIISLNER